MHIYRFDEEVSIPIDQFGSNFRVGPLTGHHATGRLQVMHLPPNGLIGRHVTAVQQLFAVITGEGVATGEDEQPRHLGPGYAAVWDPGENHDVRTEQGLTAICFEGTFDMWAVARTMDIVVADYDPAWAEWFQTLHDLIWPAVSDVAIRIDHVGSTSVPGLAAKPIIDMDIVVATEEQVRPTIERLARIGYRRRGNLGIPGREAFARPATEDGRPPHNLYVVVENNMAHQDHWRLRDLLREDAEARAEYGALKKANVALANGDIEAYGHAKEDLVTRLLERARMKP